MERSVHIPGFVALPSPTAPSGVYCLLLDGRVVYIGRSVNVYARVTRHWTNLRRWQTGKLPYHPNTMKMIEFDAVIAKFLPPEAIAAEEIRLIQRYQPKHNHQLNRPMAIDPLQIPAIVELLSRRKHEVPLDFKAIPFKKRRWARATA